MKTLMNETPLLKLLLLILVFGAAVYAQSPNQNVLAIQGMPSAQSPNPKRSNPKPEDATRAILAAFDKYEVEEFSFISGSLLPLSHPAIALAPDSIAFTKQ
jgi:hypothetical protein